MLYNTVATGLGLHPTAIEEEIRTSVPSKSMTEKRKSFALYFENTSVHEVRGKSFNICIPKTFKPVRITTGHDKPLPSSSLTGPTGDA